MNGTSKRIKIKVYCSICHTTLSTVAKPYERNLPCPECEGNVRIPPYDEIEADFRRRLSEPLNVDPGTYSIEAVGLPGAPERAQRPPEPEPIAITCPICSARLHPEIGDEPRSETCPDCFEQVRIPARSELPKKLAPLVIPNPGSYGMGAQPTVTALRTEVFERISNIKEYQPDPPPKWTFFSGVFDFPVSKHVWPRFIWMSLGLTLFGLAITFCLMLLAGGGVGGMAAAFFALPTIWMFYWSTSYSASCGMNVLEGTANGMQTIDEWPEPNWKEWMATLLYFAFLGLVAQAIAVAVEITLGPIVQSWMLSVGLIYSLFPIVLLSSLEAGSPFYPLTRPVLGSIARFPQYWLMYYLLSAGLTVGIVSLVFFSFGAASALAAPFWCGPALAAFFLIQARLLGRLAWRTLVEPDGGRKRVRKMARVHQMNADRQAEWEQNAAERKPQ